VFLNLIIISAGVYKLRLAETNFPSCYLCHARVYKLRPAEVNFLSCYTPAEVIFDKYLTEYFYTLAEGIVTR